MLFGIVHEAMNAYVVERDGFDGVVQVVHTRDGPASVQYGNGLRCNAEIATMSRFARLGDLAETSIKTITGGDSHCWLAFSYTEPTQILFSAFHSGDYPLRDVDISIRDIDLYEKTQKTGPITISEFLDLAKTRVHLNYIAPHGAMEIGPYPINEDGQNFDIQFSSPVGFWSELLQRRKVNGKWAIAMKVTQWTVEKGKLRSHDLRYRIDPAYPKVNDKVEWR